MSQPRVLYLAPRFPVESETFVSEEALGIADRGMLAGIVALTRPTEQQIERAGRIGKLAAQATTHLPRVPLQGLITAICALSKPEVRKALGSLRRKGSAVYGTPVQFLRAAAVAKVARQNRATLIYAHWPRPSEVALLASLMTGIPFAISVHAHEVVHDAGHFPLVLKHAQFAAFCNRAAMERLSETQSAEACKKFQLIYHGIDPLRFAKAPPMQLERALRLVSVGRLTPTKGFDRLLRGVAKAREVGLDVTLSILGDGGDRPRLVRLAEELQLEKVVHFLGWVDRDEMARTLAKAHAFALLADTGFHDGLPNVLLEAMAVGLAVIVSPLPAAREVLQDGVNGRVLLSADDYVGFVETCERLILEPNTRIAWGSAAADVVRRDHDKTVQLDRLATLFAKSLTCEQNPRSALAVGSAA